MTCEHEFKFNDGKQRCTRCGAFLDELCITCGDRVDTSDGATWLYFSGCLIHENCKPPYITIREQNKRIAELEVRAARTAHTG